MLRKKTMKLIAQKIKPVKITLDTFLEFFIKIKGNYTRQRVIATKELF